MAVGAGDGRCVPGQDGVLQEGLVVVIEPAALAATIAIDGAAGDGYGSTIAQATRIVGGSVADDGAVGQ